MWDTISNSNFQSHYEQESKLWKESQHLLSNPVTRPTTVHPPEYLLPEAALKKPQENFSITQNKDARLHTRNRWFLAKAGICWTFLHGSTCKPKFTVMKLQIFISHILKVICLSGRLICISREWKINALFLFHIKNYQTNDYFIIFLTDDP